MELKLRLITFEDSLALLLKEAQKGPLSIRTFLTALSGRGKMLLLIVLCLPFGQVPVIALPFGLVIGYLGMRIAFSSSHIWLPKKLLEKKIPSFVLERMLSQVLRLLNTMKRWTHPRYVWITKHPIMHKLNGIMIALVGISLAISPSIPFSSLIAFIAIFFIAIGLLNDDAVYIILGYFFAIFYFFGILGILTFFPLSKVIELFKSSF